MLDPVTFATSLISKQAGPAIKPNMSKTPTAKPMGTPKPMAMATPSLGASNFPAAVSKPAPAMGVTPGGDMGMGLGGTAKPLTSAVQGNQWSFKGKPAPNVGPRKLAPARQNIFSMPKMGSANEKLAAFLGAVAGQKLKN